MSHTPVVGTPVRGAPVLALVAATVLAAAPGRATAQQPLPDGSCPAGSEPRMPWERKEGEPACRPTTPSPAPRGGTREPLPSGECPPGAAALMPWERKPGEALCREKPAVQPTPDAAPAGGAPVRKDAGDAGAPRPSPRDVARPAEPAPAPRAPAPTPVPNGTAAALDLGDYVCQQGLAATGRTPKGTIELRRDGTYRYLNGAHAGRYRYDAQTRRLTWLTGFFTQGHTPETTFTPGRSVSQLDLTFRTDAGPLYWSCGHNR